MFTKVNARQEQFLWLVVEGMPATVAYGQVYGQDKNANTCAASASKLLTVSKVRQRHQELLAAKTARQPMTAEFLTRELIALAGEARVANQLSAAQACYMGVAKIQGLIVDRVASDVLVRKPSSDPNSADEMTPDQWLGAFAPLVIDHNSTVPIDEVSETVAPPKEEDT